MKRIVITSYFIFLFILSLFSYLFVDANFLSYRFLYSGFSTTNRELVTFLYFLFLCISFVYYGVFLVWSKSKFISLKEIKVLIVGSVLILFIAYPAMLSYDIFNYLLTDKVLFYYHENPYIVMPIEILHEPFLSFTRATNKVALYGPSWLVLAGIPFFLFSYNTILFLFGMKLLVICFYIWLVILIWRISKSAMAVTFFALNPLILYETLISGHNDVVMMAFCLYSFKALKEGKLTISLFSFSIATLIKYSVIVLFPVWIWVAIKTIKNKKIVWERIYMICSVILFLVLMIAPLREEMYPWYAVWFLSFASLLSYRKWIMIFCYLFSVGLMLRYIPYMYTGNYMGLTPLVREMLTFLPLVLFPILIIRYRKK